VALAAALVYLDLNGVELKDPEGKLYRLIMNVATGKAKKEDIVRTFKELNQKKGRAKGSEEKK
jgi:prophage maintenance system killer protein